MEIKSTGNYRLIEGQEKQSLLEKYINQPAEFDRICASVEVFQISSNLDQKIDREPMPTRTRTNFNTEIETRTNNNQDNISSLSQLISRNKAGKSRQVEYHTRSEKIFSRDNLSKTIQASKE